MENGGFHSEKMIDATDEETTISRWIEGKSVSFNKNHVDNPSVSIINGEDAWEEQDIAENIQHPGADFFRTRAKILDRQYQHKYPEISDKNKISDNFLEFTSSPSNNDSISLNDIIEDIIPINTVITPNYYVPNIDKRPIGKPILLTDIHYVDMSFDSLTIDKVDMIVPTILTVFVFDAKESKRVSNPWTFIAADPKNSLEGQPAYTTIANTPKCVRFAMSHPNEKTDIKYDNLHVVICFDRPILPKAGKSIAAYYNKPSAGNKRSAESDAKKMNLEGYKITYAYAAMPVRELVDGASSGKNVDFSTVFITDCLDEIYLSRKLNKKRKNPKFLPFHAKFHVKDSDLSQTDVLLIDQHYNVNPFFGMKFRNDLVIKFKSVSLSLKMGTKARNLAAEVFITSSDGRALDVFDGGEIKFMTHCLYHQTAPHFYDDAIIHLPYPLDDGFAVKVKFYHVDSKVSGKLSFVAEGEFNLMKDGVLLANGDHTVKMSSVQNKNTQTQDDQMKSTLTFETYLTSSVYTWSKPINLILQSDYSMMEDVQYFDLLPYLPPCLDVIIRDIANGTSEAFHCLLNIIKLFPVDQDDERFTGEIKQKYEKTEIQPIDHLMFYLRYCALRHETDNTFFNHFMAFWEQYIIQNENGINRIDVISCPFMFDILLKCCAIDKSRLHNEKFLTIIKSFQNLIPIFYEKQDTKGDIGHRINMFLSLFYKDISEFGDRGIILQLLKDHLSMMNVTDLTHDVFYRECFIEFFECALTPRTLIILCIPLHNDDYSSCAFCRYFLPFIEQRLGFHEHISQVFRIIYNVMTHYDKNEIALISNALLPIINMYGRNIKILNDCKDTHLLIYPFIIILTLLFNYNSNKFESDYGACTHFIIKTSNINLDNPEGGLELIENITETEIEEIRSMQNRHKIQPKWKTVETSQFWPRIQAICQMICIHITEITNSIYALNDIIVPLYDSKVSTALFPLLKDLSIKFIETNKELIFTDPRSCVYKLVTVIVKHLTMHNKDVLDVLWTCENSIFHTNNRMTAFFLRAIYKYKLSGDHYDILKDTYFESMAKEFIRLLANLHHLDKNNEDHHEFYADCLLELADFFIPSPDTRVKILLELANYHQKDRYNSETAVAQLTAAALVAECLSTLERLPPKVFSDMEHPANSFTIACPSASSEVISQEILKDLPKIRGFCTSKYFCECGLINLIQTTMDTCKRASLYELSTKIHSLLRPLAEQRHLWKILEKHYQNGALSWSVLEQFNSNTDRYFGLYYVVQFQDAGTYIYREHDIINNQLRQFSDKIQKRAQVISGGKPVIVVNQGESLQSNKLESDKYYVFVKTVTQYFTQQEQKTRITIFERNHNVNKFYLDIPISKKSQDNAIECTIKRIIYTVPHPLPYIVSRIRVPIDKIESMECTPIEKTISDFQKQIDHINEALEQKEWKSIEPLIAGSVNTQVNVGPFKAAVSFLTGAEENEKTMELRETARKFLDALARAVKFLANDLSARMKGQGKYSPIEKDNQEMYELGIVKLTSSLQPYLK